MPTYTFINKETGDQHDEFFTSYKGMEQYLIDNPHLKQKLVAPRTVTQVGSTLSRTSDGWKEVLKKVKKGSGRENSVNL